MSIVLFLGVVRSTFTSTLGKRLEKFRCFKYLCRQEKDLRDFRPLYLEKPHAVPTHRERAGTCTQHTSHKRRYFVLLLRNIQFKTVFFYHSSSPKITSSLSSLAIDWVTGVCAKRLGSERLAASEYGRL